MLILLNYFGFNVLSDRLFSGNGMDSVEYEAKFMILNEGRKDEIWKFLYSQNIRLGGGGGGDD